MNRRIKASRATPFRPGWNITSYGPSWEFARHRNKLFGCHCQGRRICSLNHDYSLPRFIDWVVFLARIVDRGLKISTIQNDQDIWLSYLDNRHKRYTYNDWWATKDKILGACHDESAEIDYECPWGGHHKWPPIPSLPQINLIQHEWDIVDHAGKNSRAYGGHYLGYERLGSQSLMDPKSELRSTRLWKVQGSFHH